MSVNLKLPLVGLLLLVGVGCYESNDHSSAVSKKTAQTHSSHHDGSDEKAKAHERERETQIREAHVHDHEGSVEQAEAHAKYHGGSHDLAHVHDHDSSASAQAHVDDHGHNH